MAKQTTELTTATKWETWMTTVDSVQERWFTAMREDKPMQIAMAEADAKLAMMDVIDGPNATEIKSQLLRFCDPRIDMVEVVGQPSNDAKIKVVAMAIVSGFTPGRAEFSVYVKQGSDAALYVKENGYLVWFERSGASNPPNVNTEFPELKTLANGKLVWLVSGIASVTLNGKKFTHEAIGKHAIGIAASASRSNPKESTDNIASITAKARRALLQQLWKKARPFAGTQDYDDSHELESVTVADPKMIEVVPVVETVTSTTPSSPAEWDRHWKSMSERGDKIDERTLQIARALRAAPSKEMLVVAMIEADADRSKIDDANYEMLKAYYTLLDGMLVN